MPQQPYEILQQSSSIGGFDPVKLRMLREARQRELQERMANEVGAGDAPAAQRSSLLANFLEQDMSDDPYTGEAEQARVGGIQKGVDAVDFYNRPEVTQQRREEQSFQLAKAAVPGNAARDVASINAMGDVEAARLRGGSDWAEPTVAIPDPAGSGGTYPVPRTIAGNPNALKQFIDQYKGAGFPANRGMAARDKIDAYRSLLGLAGQIHQTGEATDWGGVGAVMGPLQSLRMRFTGGGDPRGEQLRNQMRELFAESAFARGGKQLTGPERQMMQEFLATVNANPQQAKVRLAQFINSAQRNLAALEGGQEGATADTGGGMAVDLPEADNFTMGDAAALGAGGAALYKSPAILRGAKNMLGRPTAVSLALLRRLLGAI